MANEVIKANITVNLRKETQSGDPDTPDLEVMELSARYGSVPKLPRLETKPLLRSATSSESTVEEVQPSSTKLFRR